MKFQYPITADYVRDWSLREALRELVANGLDGQTALGARFEAKHDAKRDILHLVNYGVKVDVKALYFGGTSKSGDKRLIGQYGEGLKLAMLVCARTGVKLVIRNGDEVWSPTIEEDKLGHNVLTLNIRKGSEKNQDFHIEVHSISSESWHLIQDMFLALRSPVSTETTSRGQVLYDADFVGKVFVKGVYCTTRPNYSTGYNFNDLDIGRDRRIPSSWDIDYELTKMWEEIATRDVSNNKRIYKMLRQDGAEVDALRYTTTPQLSKAIADEFREEFGQDAIPVTSVSDASELEHVGKTGVIMSHALAAVLKNQFPTVAQIKHAMREDVVERIQLHDLNEAERAVLKRGVEIVSTAAGQDVGAITAIVRFRDSALRGLHKDGELLISRSELATIGGFSVVLLHEFAHHFGADGEKGHIDTIQRYMEKIINAAYP